MTEQELLALMGLDDSLTSPSPSPPSSTTREEIPSEEIPINSTVMKVSKWDLERAAKMISDQAIPLSTEALADFFTLCFNRLPEKNEGRCSDAIRQKYIEEMTETPDYEALRASTKGNELASEMAARKIADQFLRLKKKEERKNPDSQPPPNKKWEGEMAPDLSSLLAASKAVEEAQREQEEIEEMGRSLGIEPGDSNGPESSLNPKKVIDAYLASRNNPMVRKTCDRAGRFRRAAQSKQRTKVKHGVDDVVGVTMGGELSNILPLELAAFADPDLEFAAMKKFADRQMMAREREDREKKKAGPIVLCVDESSSMMRGDRIIDAKAFALTMAWVAKKQNRYCCLFGFAAGRVYSSCILKPGKWNQEALLSWIGHFFSGGTSLDVPCSVVPSLWNEIGAPKGKTDMIILTDGHVRIDAAMKQSFLSWKEKEKVKVYSLIIGSNDGGGVEEIADDISKMAGISPESVDHCLGISG